MGWKNTYYLPNLRVYRRLVYREELAMRGKGDFFNTRPDQLQILQAKSHNPLCYHCFQCNQKQAVLLFYKADQKNGLQNLSASVL